MVSKRDFFGKYSTYPQKSIVNIHKIYIENRVRLHESVQSQISYELVGRSNMNAPAKLTKKNGYNLENFQSVLKTNGWPIFEAGTLLSSHKLHGQSLLQQVGKNIEN